MNMYVFLTKRCIGIEYIELFWIEWECKHSYVNIQSKSILSIHLGWDKKNRYKIEGCQKHLCKCIYNGIHICIECSGPTQRSNQ